MLVDYEPIVKCPEMIGWLLKLWQGQDQWPLL
jgi:hypothetical protein